jgi:hypothetical protein
MIGRIKEKASAIANAVLSRALHTVVIASEILNEI